MDTNTKGPYNSVGFPPLQTKILTNTSFRQEGTITEAATIIQAPQPAPKASVVQAQPLCFRHLLRWWPNNGGLNLTIIAYIVDITTNYSGYSNGQRSVTIKTAIKMLYLDDRSSATRKSFYWGTNWTTGTDKEKIKKQNIGGTWRYLT